MKSFIVVALFIAAASAASLSPDSEAVIVSQEQDNIGVNGYRYGVKTSNGIEASEVGELKNVGTEDEALEVRGQFSYVGKDGVTYLVTYIANEKGYQPSGAHLPTA